MHIQDSEGTVFSCGGISRYVVYEYSRCLTDFRCVLPSFVTGKGNMTSMDRDSVNDVVRKLKEEVLAYLKGGIGLPDYTT